MIFVVYSLFYQFWLLIFKSNAVVFYIYSDPTYFEEFKEFEIKKFLFLFSFISFDDPYWIDSLFFSGSFKHISQGH